jgi:hypothetical protein
VGLLHTLTIGLRFGRMSPILRMHAEERRLRDPSKWRLFRKEQGRLESEFLLLTEYIPLAPDLNASNFQFGSPRAAAFGPDCGTWVETCLAEHLQSPRFDTDPEVRDARSGDANIDLYRRILGTRLGLVNLSLVTRENAISVRPFESFEQDQNPEWFRTYSRLKHRRIDLAETWTMRGSLECTAALVVPLREFVEPGHVVADASQVFSSVYMPSQM